MDEEDGKELRTAGWFPKEKELQLLCFFHEKKMRGEQQISQ